MNVLGHNHVTNHHEAVASAHLFHNFEKQIATPWRAEESASLIATGRKEVKISGAVVTMQSCRHPNLYHRNQELSVTTQPMTDARGPIGQKAGGIGYTTNGA